VGVAILQILSPITKFCPVYTILNKLMPDTTPKVVPVTLVHAPIAALKILTLQHCN